jgi:hypothetical protein
MKARIMAAVTALGLAFPVTAAQAEPAANAAGSWSMVPMSKDTNGDGFIDGDGGVPKRGALSAAPSPTFVGANNFIAQPNERLIDGILSWHLNPRGYPVRLDACRSTGKTYTWSVLSGAKVVATTKPRPLTRKKCETTIMLPEGRYHLKLQVRSGGSTDTAKLTANVDNILFVAMGDSYASGEGNPRNVDAFLAQGSAGFTPYWDDDACNRSARGAPAQAALRLEDSSPKTSVTFVYVACTGATVPAGILGAQRANGQTASQIEQVASIIGDRTIDILTLAIGGNDVGFTSILSACALARNCPLAKAPFGSLAAFPTVQDGVQTRTAGLPAAFDRIARCFNGPSCVLADGRTIPSLRIANAGRVLPTLYPDITRSASGAPCTYLTITDADFAWARDTMLTPSTQNPFPYRTTQGTTVNLTTNAGTLNGTLLTTNRLGWSPAVGTWGASGESTIGRGVCAGAEAWFFGVTGLVGFTSGSFHPNPLGLRAMGKQIASAVAGVLGIRFR